MPEEKLFISILNLSQLNEKPMSGLQLRKIGLWIMEIGDMQKICPIKKICPLDPTLKEKKKSYPNFYLKS